MNSLIPLPQKIELRPGRLPVPAQHMTCYCDIPFLHVERVLGIGALHRVAAPQKAFLALLIQPDVPALRAVAPALRREAYHLEIGVRGIWIAATDLRGLFYGLQTLRQIMAKHTGALPMCRILDWPNLPLRGVHLDLFANTPTFNELKGIITRLGAYKVNTICLEYDDRFSWERHPDISHPLAFTKGQIAALIELAAAYGIQMIPLLDSLGHAGQYLCHAHYASLRELPDRIEEMCPSNPKTLVLMKELWEEVLEVHRGAKYAHISGDEVFRLGCLCPRCTRRARLRGMAGIYTDYYTKLSRWVLEQGKRPIMWGDMLIKCPEDIDHFPKDILINDWCYFGENQPWWDYPLLKWHPLFKKYGTLLDADMAAAARNRAISPRDRRLLSRYWVDSWARRRFTPFPHVRFLQDHGFEIIGASKASGDGVDTPPSTSGRFANNMQFALVLKKAGAAGLINTFWSHTGPIMNAWYGLVAGADFAWHSREENESIFARRFSERFLSISPGFGEVIRSLDQQFNLSDQGYRPSIRKSHVQQARRLAGACSASASGEPVYAAHLNRMSAINLMRQTAIQKEQARRRALFGKGHDECIDLRAWCNRNFYNCAPNQAAYPLPLPCGLHKIEGIPFDVIDLRRNQGRSLIALRGGRNGNGPVSVGAIPVRRRLNALFVLLTGFDVARQVQLAALHIHLEGGRQVEVPLIGGSQLGDWSGPKEKKLDKAFVAWKNNMGRYAYVTWWRNPWPRQQVLGIKIVSAEPEKGYLMVIAMTARLAKQGPARCAHIGSTKANACRNKR
ncbi:MAG: family 20 glycosylhydrolase [Kiritimatiellae bacterium]|nr:family 20 glycosylhydrolase [Kiritimatiellia bacterium]